MTNHVIDRFDGVHAFLSNFHACSVFYQGIHYPSSEHAYQAQKTMVNVERKTVASLDTPQAAKRWAKSIVIRPDWDQVKLFKMHRILQNKFLQSRTLMAKLAATGDAILIEGNTWGDTFWGVFDGEGRNMLGNLLMLVRSEVFTLYPELRRK